MRSLIQQLEQTARTLEPSPAQQEDWDNSVQAYAHDFPDHIETTKAYHFSENPAASIPAYPFGDSPKPLEEVLKVLN